VRPGPPPLLHAYQDRAPSSFSLGLGREEDAKHGLSATKAALVGLVKQLADPPTCVGFRPPQELVRRDLQDTSQRNERRDARLTQPTLYPAVVLRRESDCLGDLRLSKAKRRPRTSSNATDDTARVLSIRLPQGATS
jgi:hypothetical protein